jgi:hypothetical protein
VKGIIYRTIVAAMLFLSFSLCAAAGETGMWTQLGAGSSFSDCASIKINPNLVHHGPHKLSSGSISWLPESKDNNYGLFIYGSQGACFYYSYSTENGKNIHIKRFNSYDTGAQGAVIPSNADNNKVYINILPSGASIPEASNINISKCNGSIIVYSPFATSISTSGSNLSLTACSDNTAYKVSGGNLESGEKYRIASFSSIPGSSSSNPVSSSYFNSDHGAGKNLEVSQAKNLEPQSGIVVPIDCGNISNVGGSQVVVVALNVQSGLISAGNNMVYSSFPAKTLNQSYFEVNNAGEYSAIAVFSTTHAKLCPVYSSVGDSYILIDTRDVVYKSAYSDKSGYAIEPTPFLKYPIGYATLRISNITNFDREPDVIDYVCGNIPPVYNVWEYDN